MKISEKTNLIAIKAEESEQIIYGYSSNQIKRDFHKLINGESVEVGYRAGCGRTDRTHKIFKEWLKIVKSLRKDGFIIEEKNIIHANKSPTMAQGYWNSIIYLINPKKIV